MKKKIMGICMFILLFTGVNQAQLYRYAGGLRLGYWDNFGALTFKMIPSNDKAYELIIQVPWNGVILTGLYEIQKSLPIMNNLDWYFGFGGHLGAFDANKYDKKNTSESAVILGADAILGLEYKFIKVPFSIGIDWKPSINLNGYNDHATEAGSISIRYVFR